MAVSGVNTVLRQFIWNFYYVANRPQQLRLSIKYVIIHFFFTVYVIYASEQNKSRTAIMDTGHVLQMLKKIRRENQKPEPWLRESTQKPLVDSNPATALKKQRRCVFPGTSPHQRYFSPEASSQAAAYFFTSL